MLYEGAPEPHTRISLPPDDIINVTVASLKWNKETPSFPIDVYDYTSIAREETRVMQKQAAPATLRDRDFGFLRGEPARFSRQSSRKSKARSV